MKKIQNILMLVAIAALASCSDNEVAPNAPADDEQVTVAITASPNQFQQSREANDQGDEKVTRCLLQIVDPANEDNMSIVLTGDPDGDFTGEVRLYKNKTYNLLFWADCGADYYTATNADATEHNLKEISVATGAEVSVAYAHHKTWSYDTDGSTISAKLNHAVAKITLKTTVDLAEESEISMSGIDFYSKYNVENGEGIGDVSTDPYEYTTSAKITGDATSGAEVFTIYALVKDATPTLTLQCDYGDGIEVSNVPIKANTHTTLIGDVTGKTDANITVKINPAWTDKDEDVPQVTQ